ncbi:hypothetical protein MMC25_007824 [Agyrium rufum]|nr:hypothetical protein [Agyrium rufum]
MASAGAGPQIVQSVAQEALNEAAQDPDSSFWAIMQHARSFGGVFSYLTSKWALACFAIGIILNRTQIFASGRRHLVLRWPLRLLLRILPLVMFFFHSYSILQAIRCQTSPLYSEYKYGKPDIQVAQDYASEGGPLHRLSSMLLFFEDEKDTCNAVNMIPPKLGSADFRGSLSMLWPIFQSLCFSQFIETLSCTLQGRTVKTETGMNIFEHSLAFAEAEAMANNQITISTLSLFRPGTLMESNKVLVDPDPSIAATATPLSHVNTPPEVLLMVLISCLNNLTSHVLGVFGLQARFRLVNTGVWALCFMSSFIYSFCVFSLSSGIDVGLLRFPTVCIVGFIPHLLLLIGIMMCAFIYMFAVLVATLSPPQGTPPGQSWMERYHMARDNLQINISLSSLRLNMQEDFYTALLRVGFAALTAASEAVYLNEGHSIAIRQWTWLEEERMNEIEASGEYLFAGSTAFAQLADGDDSVTSGIVFQDKDAIQRGTDQQWQSGYGRERTTKMLRGQRGNNAKLGSDSVGAFQRGGRYILAWEFLSGIFALMTSWLLVGITKILNRLGMTNRPVWLRRWLEKPRVIKPVKQTPKQKQDKPIDFWLLSDEGVVSLPQNDDIDVEVETKKRQRMATTNWGRDEERKLDQTLYEWWSRGGWWGERDSSGEYIDLSDEEDNTSVITTADDGTSSAWDSDPEDHEGARTPTQNNPHYHSNRSTRESTPVAIDLSIEPSHLASLLNPADDEHRAEARILAHHLQSDRIVTRSQHRAYSNLNKAQVLTSTRYRPSSAARLRNSGKLSPFEEAQLLEHLIITRRAHRAATSEGESSAAGAGASWRQGAEGLGAGGPHCVVCQSSPRTVLAWPCRCLSLCEDCRVSLAMNNFGTCVCCRGEVVGFSRLFVP